MNKEIELSITATFDEVKTFFDSNDGFEFEFKPPKLAYDCALEVARPMELVIYVGSSVAIGVLSAWIYDMLKGKETKSAEINKTVISGKNVTVNQIQNIININIGNDNSK